MTGEPTVILGIEIPSTDPVFIAVIVGVHIPLGLACVVAGAVAMLSEKRRGRHSSAGKVYYWCLLALFASMTFLSVMRWAENYHCLSWVLCPSHLHGLAAARFGSAGPAGRGYTLRGWGSHTF
jgi:uncharacterized membrane protein